MPRRSTRPHPGPAARPPLVFAFARALATALLATSAAVVLAACSAKPTPPASVPPSSPATAPASPATPSPAPSANATEAPSRLDHLSLTLRKRWSGFSSPLYVTSARDGSGRLFVVEQEGRVRTIVDGAVQASPYLDLHTQVSFGGEQGLLGLAFSPTFATDGRIYVDYTDVDGNTVIARYTTTTPASSKPKWSPPTTLFHIGQPYANHNGGCLVFGPDGYLYIGVGDGGSGGDPGRRAQNKSELLGKILRVDPSRSSATKPYVIPPTNPSKLTASSVQKPAPEVWARGMRNPWRFSFDAKTGDLWVADVGQGAWEEIDRVTPRQAETRAEQGGLNFGWPAFEGLHEYPSGKLVPEANRSPGLVWPIYDYPHPTGGSITGGYVYRGSKHPALVGTYMYADYVYGWVGGVRLTAPDGTRLAAPEARTLLNTRRSPSSFGVDENDELYLVDLQGSIYEVQGTAK